jgi:hypothetical protein
MSEIPSTERAAIVAWLREQAMSPKRLRVDGPKAIVALADAANAIERGEHLPTRNEEVE